MSERATPFSWGMLLRLAAPYRAKFVVIALLAALATAAELVEPLIYRTAVNDVSGVFVQRAVEHARTADSQVGSTTHQSAQGNHHPPTACAPYT